MHLQSVGMEKTPHFLRRLRPRVVEALRDSPVVLIHGPRQSGKTTLARDIAAAEGYTYFTFDDDVRRGAAQADPVGFVADLPDRVVLDEVQRVPELFTSLKADVDRHRLPGRFILTGSANVLMLPDLADSLAGRMSVLALHPLGQAEIEGTAGSFLEDLVRGDVGTDHGARRLASELADRVAAGGFPAAILRASPQRRAAWYRDYAETILQRDVRDLARITALDVMPRLLTAAAGQTGQLSNISDLASPFQVSRPTIREYVTILSRMFLLEELPPWHTNRLKRLVKTPKIHLTDTGLACSILNVTAADMRDDRRLFGQMLETFVYGELRRQASWLDTSVSFSHFRTKDQIEVDVVIEHGRHLSGVEVKAGSTVRAEDFKGLRMLRDTAGPRFSRGILLYDGADTVPFGPSLYAMPIARLWEQAGG
jgi:uncharacterized protein